MVAIAGTGPIKSQLWVGEGITGLLSVSDRGREVTVHLSTINGLLSGPGHTQAPAWPFRSPHLHY